MKIIILALTLIGRTKNGGVDDAGAEVRTSLTEMPLEKLLNVKQALNDDLSRRLSEPSDSMDENDVRVEIDEKMADESASGAMPLKGDWFDQLRKQKKKPKLPLRRGDWDDEKGSEKGDLSKIFQTTITVLSFLAFGGYLLCMICMAIRNNQGIYQNTTTTTTTGRRKRDIFFLEESIFLDATTEGLHRLAEGYAKYHFNDR